MLFFFFFLHFFIVFFSICRREIGYFQAFFNMTTVKKAKLYTTFLGCGLLEGRRNNKLPVRKKECCYYCLFL